MQLFLWDDYKIPAQSHFIIGSSSSTAIGQISADYLLSLSALSPRGLRRIGCIESNLVLPMTGNEKLSYKDEESILCMPIEVYALPLRENLYLIQQRSPCIAGSRKRFAEQLISLLSKSLQSSLLIILTGAGTEDVEFNLRDNRLFSIFTEAGLGLLQNSYPELHQYMTTKTSCTLWTKNSESQLQHHGSSSVFSFAVDQSPYMESPYPTLPRGMHLAKHILFNECSTNDDVDAVGRKGQAAVVVLGQLGANGDHMRDGVAMAKSIWTAIESGSNDTSSSSGSSSDGASGHNNDKHLAYDRLPSHHPLGPVSWSNSINYLTHRNDEMYFS